MSQVDLKQQLQHYLASLQAAGVQWLPTVGAALSALEVTTFAPTTVLPLPTGDVPRAAAGPPPAPQFAQPLSSTGAMSAETRRQELAVLAQTVAGCTRCKELAPRRTQTVFGVGPVSPELCFIGEGPGATEDAQGEPFVGEAGQLLNKIIAACGMKRAEVYICNIVKCRPPGNRVPLPDEAANCSEYLLRQLELVAPKFICALGACAAQNLLGSKESVGRLRGRLHDFRGIPVFCTYHPAYLLRSPEKKRDVWEDMQKLLAHMGRPVPAKQT